MLVLGGEITITRDNCPTTFRAGQCFEVPTGCMHAEHVGREGVALLSGRRRKPADAERRQLTVMFCDLVGSTALAAGFASMRI